MSSLDAEVIQQFMSAAVRERLVHIEVFSEIESTNSYLMQMPGPEPGTLCVAATSNQTAGRGRHGKTWRSPPGTGLCLSAAYTYQQQPEDLPALSLTLGLAAIDALQDLGADRVELKWPNDLVARDGKLAGILTETKQHSASAVTVVTGIGINVDLSTEPDFGAKADWARTVVDLKSICEVEPGHEELAGQLATHLLGAFVDFEISGFAAQADRWPRYDWLLGREITIDTADVQYSGIGAGVANDGALLVETPGSGLKRVTSGTVVRAGSRGERI